MIVHNALMEVMRSAKILVVISVCDYTNQLDATNQRSSCVFLTLHCIVLITACGIADIYLLKNFPGKKMSQKKNLNCVIFLLIK